MIVLVLTWAAIGVHAQAPLTFNRAIPLPGVKGRIDHLAVDLSRHRLYVAALGNDTVEVVDTRSMRRRQSLAGFHEPQGIAVVPSSGLVVVANGEGGAVDVLDPDSFRALHHIPLGDDADNVRWDARSSLAFVGYGRGGVAAIEPASGRTRAETPLPGHPESFQLESSGPLMFVNLPSTQSVAVLDRDAARATATWRLTTAAANYPMALDQGRHRLFVGCREPARLVVLDTANGRSIGSTAIVGDADDLFFDAARNRVYVTGGEGFIDVLAERNGEFMRVARVPTARGARTSLFVPDEQRLYVAVPARDGRDAEVQIYDAH